MHGRFFSERYWYCDIGQFLGDSRNTKYSLYQNLYRLDGLKCWITTFPLQETFECDKDFLELNDFAYLLLHVT